MEGEREREKTERSVEVERGSATEREPSRLSRTKKIQILTAASPRHKAPFRLIPLDEVLVAAQQAEQQVRDKILRQRDRGDDAKDEEQERHFSIFSVD